MTNSRPTKSGHSQLKGPNYTRSQLGAWGWISLLVCVMTAINLIHARPNAKAPTHTPRRWPTKLVAQPSAPPGLPMYCPHGQAKSIWQLPQSPPCQIKDTEEDHHEVEKVELQLFKANIVQYKSPAFHCVKIKRRFGILSYFFADNFIKKQEVHHLAISMAECKDLLSKKSQYGPVYDSEGIFQTQNKIQWKYPAGGVQCCRYHWYEATNVYMYTGHVYKRFREHNVESTLGDTRGCRYKQQACALADKSIIIWEVNKKALCSHIPWTKVKGVQYGNTWVSDDHQMALTFTPKKRR